MQNPLSRLFWELVERGFDALYRVESVGEGEQSLFRISRTTYHGPDLTLSDGTVVRNGERVGELHFRREPMLAIQARYDDPQKMGFAFVRILRRSLRELAEFLDRAERYKDLNAFRATTLFHDGSEMFGFDVMDIASKRERRFFSWYLRTLMARDHRFGAARIARKERPLEARIVWISRAELLRRHLRAK